ncbi:phosphodiester glycosidase family protein [Bacillus sp. FJAT-26390]|uniref:phosphodiester glycosidase family protein n=1 Tax=Bacillus sp. FJAT-26390 TaxID=1743142 RepID=UPI000AE8FDAA|nr:phosphodiester glycosidase family protein [Bacillus sp. FJAT-26390]
MLSVLISCQELIVIKNLTKRKKAALFLTFIVLAIGIVLYVLADRYLIEHVEVNVAAKTPAAAAPAANPADGTETLQQDDWNYSSADTQIHIKKVESGSGSDKITYFVADVQLTDASVLQSAFAKNAFGRNITEDTSAIAAENGAVFAINGDYYGFRNDGVIVRGGTLYRDEPTRDAMALLSNGTMKAYNEEQLSSAELLAEGVTDTYSFGPILVNDGAIAGDFDKVAIDTNFGNRSIQGSNPRTGIGMIAPNHYVFVVVDGRKDNYSKGMTLTEFANVFTELGASVAYNLDGGGSSTMYFMGRVVNNPLGKQQERGVSDILYIAK